MSTPDPNSGNSSSNNGSKGNGDSFSYPYERYKYLPVDDRPHYSTGKPHEGAELWAQFYVEAKSRNIQVKLDEADQA